MGDLRSVIDDVAASSGFSGVVRVDVHGSTELHEAYGLADRAHGVAMTTDTTLGLASAAKTMTAVVVLRLVEEGVLSLDTRARSLLGSDLPLVSGEVTVEQLLAHRSGIGDYLDETELGSMTDYVMPVPVHELATTEDYVRVLDGLPPAFAAGEGFAYNNAGFVLLALLAERASGAELYDLVRTRVCEPAGMTRTSFPRSDELPGDAAIGYLHATGLRSNVLHLPVRGSGDGGIHSTATDLHAFWAALLGGRLLSPDHLAEMLRPRTDWPDERRRYGLGIHLDAEGDGAFLEGADAGVSMRSRCVPSTGLTWTVVASWTDGAWPVVRALDQHLAEG